MLLDSHTHITSQRSVENVIAHLEIYRLCGEVGWPVLLPFDYQDFHNYNVNVEALDKVLESCPAFNGPTHTP